MEPTPVARDSNKPAVEHLLGELRSENEWSELVLGNLQEGVLAVDGGARVLLANHALHRLRSQLASDVINTIFTVDGPICLLFHGFFDTAR